MSKKNKNKQFKSSKKTNIATPVEEKVIEDEKETTEVAENSEKEEIVNVEVATDQPEKSKSKASKKADKLAKKAEAKNKSRWAKDFKAELKKIVWPSGKELFDNTVVVIAMVIIVSVLIFVLDLAFQSLNKLEVKELNNLKTQMTSSTTSNETTDSNTTENANEVEATNSLTDSQN